MLAVPGCGNVLGARTAQRYCPSFPQQQQQAACSNLHRALPSISGCGSLPASHVDRISHHPRHTSTCSLKTQHPQPHPGPLTTRSSAAAPGFRIAAGICSPTRRLWHQHTTHASSSQPADSSGQQPNPSPSSSSTPSSHASQWDRTTDHLVASASLPFSVLVLPQVFQNLLNMYSGNAAALSIISWEGYVSGLLGNTLMCTHFAGRGERSAVNVQLIGMASNAAILTQVALAGFMPAAVFSAAVALAAVAAALNVGRLQGRLQDPAPIPAPSGGQGSSAWSSWRLWQLVCGTLGLAVVPQILGNIFAPGQLGLQQGVGTGTLLLLLGLFLFFQAGGAAKRQAQLQVVGQLPGWGATLLFALSPLPQLVRNFLEPQSLQGLSVASMLLALLGNGMMLPRALFTADPVWIAGTTWACTAGWGQVLSMFLGTSAATGQRYLAAAPFAAVTVALLAFVSFTLVMDAKSKSRSG